MCAGLKWLHLGLNRFIPRNILLIRDFLFLFNFHWIPLKQGLLRNRLFEEKSILFRSGLWCNLLLPLAEVVALHESGGGVAVLLGLLYDLVAIPVALDPPGVSYKVLA